ncbi:MAG: DUF1566 domain-containing protein [Deltaproteobacteria bacterium]|nr:DUF1566 domain-containing protein [Deltaproteobacteria bacterium]
MTENRQRRRLGQVVLLATGLLSWALLPVTPARAGNFPATGQTTVYQADKHNGAGLDAIPDDGTLQRGATLHYKVLHDGTVGDMNTGLIWEVKCSHDSDSRCPALHDVDKVYPWSGDGATDTIWDWLVNINNEGGTGYAGHHDWRIPNVRELRSIVDYGVFDPAINPIFGPTATTAFSAYWSSTTSVGFPEFKWGVDFSNGADDELSKANKFPIRAVRGGEQ